MTVPVAEVPFGSVSPPMIVALAIVAVAYAKRAHTLHGQGRPLSRARQTAFYVAIAVLIAEPLSPLGATDDDSFVSHMIEHLVIGDVAALLMVLGINGPVIQPLLRIRAVSSLRWLAHPAVALPVWVLNLYVWHIPGLFEAALAHEPVHIVQHMLFFAVGFNMWMPIFGPLPAPAWFGNIARLVYVVAVRLAAVLLGNVFVFSDAAFYEPYIDATSFWGLSPNADQSTAGAVMMIEGSLIGFGLFAWLFVRAAIEGEQSQDLVDLAREHGVELSERRSARAAAAGTTDLLRERITRAGDGTATPGDDPHEAPPDPPNV